MRSLGFPFSLLVRSYILRKYEWSLVLGLHEYVIVCFSFWQRLFVNLQCRQALIGLLGFLELEGPLLGFFLGFIRSLLVFLGTMRSCMILLVPLDRSWHVFGVKLVTLRVYHGYLAFLGSS